MTAYTFALSSVVDSHDAHDPSMYDKRTIILYSSSLSYIHISHTVYHQPIKFEGMHLILYFIDHHYSY